jgi:hypothetical protein
VEIHRLFSNHLLAGSEPIFNRQLEHECSLMALPIYTLLTIFSIFVSHFHRVKGHTMTTWLCDRGKPRLLTYFFFFNLIGIYGSIAAQWLCYHIVVWEQIRKYICLDGSIHDPDRMFGLDPLGGLIWHSYFVIMSAVLLIVIWIVGMQLGVLGDKVRSNPGIIAGAALILVTGLLVVLWPVIGIHQKMKDAKRDDLTRLASQIVDLSDIAEAHAGSVSLSEASVAIRLNFYQRLYRDADLANTWPLSFTELSSLNLGLLVTALNPIVGYLLNRKSGKLNRKQDKRRRRKTDEVTPKSVPPTEHVARL